MLAEVIKQVRNSEDNAEEITRRAHTDSKRIVQNAERKAGEIVQQSVANAEAEARRILAAAEVEGEKLVVPIRERTKEEIAALQAQARQKQEPAVEMVMERIVKIYGHS
ncbi:MAG: hypothetical protein SCK29_09725 [Bacillota bacterium]|nr:hypothetical protein [Bacillota bacterium]MDW7684379.1 hypothetical protein [Bacillota bacterium]